MKKYDILLKSWWFKQKFSEVKKHRPIHEPWMFTKLSQWLENFEVSKEVIHGTEYNLEILLCQEFLNISSSLYKIGRNV